MIEKKSKAAEVNEKTTIVGFIVLIIGFAVIVLSLTVFNWRGNVDREVCYDSIVLRSSAKIGMLQFKETIPLNCRTQKICFTSSTFGDKCPALGKSSSESPIIKIKAKTSQELASQIAELYYQDWGMVGKGLLNPMPRGFYKDNYCMFTSRFVLDSEITEEVNFYMVLKSLEEKKDEKGNSYLYSLYGVKSADEIYNSFPGEVKSQFTSGYAASKEYVLAFNFAEKGWGTSVMLGVGAGALTFLVLPAAVPATLAGILIAGVGGATTLNTMQDPNSNPQDKKEKSYLFNHRIFQYSKEGIDALNCDEIETIAA